MNEAEQIADQAIDWLRDRYDQFTFFLERDVVWTLQLRVLELIREQNANLRLFSDYPMIRGPRRAISADLAFLSPDGVIQLAIEFKYEPSHNRPDIPRAKLPVVVWGMDGVAKDIERARKFVSQVGAVAARSYFIDEGGYFSRRPPHPESSWIAWPGKKWVLFSSFPRGELNSEIPASDDAASIAF